MQSCLPLDLMVRSSCLAICMASSWQNVMTFPGSAQPVFPSTSAIGTSPNPWLMLVTFRNSLFGVMDNAMQIDPHRK